MVYKIPCTPVQEFDELITSPNPEILQIALSLKNMPLQDPTLIASSSKPPSHIPSLLSPQNPQPTQNPSPCLTQTNPPGFENLRNHPIYPTPQAAGRTNSGARVTLDGLMDKSRSMVFTMDAALAHTCQLLNHAKEASQKSSNQEQNNNFSLLQELRNNMEQMDILVDHGTTLTILETQLCESLQREGDIEARMGRFEKMIGDVGKSVGEVGKAVGHLHTIITARSVTSQSSASLFPSQSFAPCPP